MVAGYPVIDIKATLFDGSYHDVDSSEMAYKIAASMALKEAGKKCKPAILEPIMFVEVTAPSEFQVVVDKSLNRKNVEMPLSFVHMFHYQKCSDMLQTYVALLRDVETTL